MTSGLRERKKQLTRTHVATTAARLFGELGYENVSVADVAAAADVSLQTVYNYFGSKRELVLDREDEITSALVRAIVERPAAMSVVTAVRPIVLSEVTELRARTKEQIVGDLPILCAVSAEVRRYALESRDRQAEAVARAIIDTGGPGVAVFAARAQAGAVLSVLQSFVDHTGRRLHDGVTPAKVAAEVGPLVVAALDDLEQRYAVRGRRARRS